MSEGTPAQWIKSRVNAQRHATDAVINQARALLNTLPPPAKNTEVDHNAVLALRHALNNLDATSSR